MRPRKVTARISFSVDGGHVATIALGRKTVPRVAGALAERAALKRYRSDDMLAWLLNVAGETTEDIADSTGRSENAVRSAIGRVDAGRHESEDIEIYEVTPVATEAQIKAQAKYDAKNTKQLHLKLNRKTDWDVIEKLGNVPNMQGYIKRLIRADLEK